MTRGQARSALVDAARAMGRRAAGSRAREYLGAHNSLYVARAAGAKAGLNLRDHDLRQWAPLAVDAYREGAGL